MQETHHHFQLIKTLRLLKDDITFEIDFENFRHHLWILNHFGHLKIKSYTLHYTKTKSYRSRSTAEFPRIKMKKTVENTSELLQYLWEKCYQVHDLKITFENNWMLYSLFGRSFRIKTNKQLERDQLIKQLLTIAGPISFEMENLKNDSSYMIMNTKIGSFLSEMNNDAE